MTSSEPGGARAIVAGHGTFAQGVISAVAQISGRGDDFVGLSNAGLGAAEILDVLRARLGETGARVIFTDLPAGSWTIAARRLLRERADLVLVTGANLATLLDFALGGVLAPGEAARHAAEKGRASLVVLGGETSGTEAAGAA
jgi:PTS system N-acetylgalactosamine-specific IIA component